ncbi:tripartite tricarboxylate transporter TctB family protein [Aliiruegeria sabulilitoris]|uniref:tripartite tricarboxylate transporter TctB family protein n=1 Tax=Aliiruegeria sabulilitoris TaxID=1510458 RepID=UPI00082D0A93|nr:tripartite tricarboxylate transporter TctB family protein [Aliiruegeria sabulilitoris]
MKFNDAVSGVFFILFALLLFYLTRDYPGLYGQTYGSDLFPRVIAALMGLSGVVLVVKGAKEWSATPVVTIADWMRSPRHVGNFFAVLAALVFYILLSDWLGFIITGGAVLTGLMVWLRGAAYWKSSILIALLAVVVIQAFFGELLRVPLPWGLLENYSW